jgi:hypothetical protein
VVAGERGQCLIVKDLGDEPNVFVVPSPAPVGYCDAGGLLPSVLKGKETEERELGSLLARRRGDTDDSALLHRMVVVHHGDDGLFRHD